MAVPGPYGRGVTTAAALPARDLRTAVWWITLGAGSGALAGIVFGGVGGRLAMLVLRVNSPGAVGLTSDAGFEIGRFTVGGSLSLLAFTAVVGALVGLAYVALRTGVRGPARIPAAALVAATAGGSAFLEPDGIDLLVLEPLWFAVTAFVALPALAAAAAAALVERLGDAGSSLALVERAPRWLGAAARVAVSGLLLALIVVQGQELLAEITEIL